MFILYHIPQTLPNVSSGLYHKSHTPYIIRMWHVLVYLFTHRETREIERVCVCARACVFSLGAVFGSLFVYSLQHIGTRHRSLNTMVCVLLPLAFVYSLQHIGTRHRSLNTMVCVLRVSWLFRFKMKHVEKACNRPVTDLPDKVILISLTSELNPKTCPYTVLNPNRST